MIVLIVDDQTNVVSGIYFGVRWKEIGVTKVLKAYNAMEAKKILQSQVIDIILCDIEMPVENGLMLLRWIREMQMVVECIFLTSHADFIYAKEALQLESFDYILQPARYEDIEKAIAGAMDKIKKQRESNKYLSYGKLLFDKRRKVLQALLRENLHDNKLNTASIKQYFNDFGINITHDSFFRIALIQFFNSEIDRNGWEDGLLLFGINNILSELSEPYGQNILLVRYSSPILLSFIFPSDNIMIDDSGINRIFSHLLEILHKHFQMEVACYFSKALQIQDLRNQLDRLTKTANDNISERSGVFSSEDIIGGIERQLPGDWSFYLDLPTVKESMEAIREQLNNLKATLDSNGLRQFYYNFMQIISHLAQSHNLTLNDIFDTPDAAEISMNGYNSLGQMYELIKFVDKFFQDYENFELESRNQIERIINYIRSNISEEIRRSDIADVVYLTPNYISRLFRMKMNISLKDFIVEEKMKVAQSLILTTKLPISVIATKVGYSNFSYFSQSYKKVFGHPPTSERANSEKNF